MSEVQGKTDQPMTANPVIVRLAEIVSASNSTFVFYHGKTYSINDANCPKAAVVAYVKSQLKAVEMGG